MPTLASLVEEADMMIERSGIDAIRSQLSTIKSQMRRDRGAEARLKSLAEAIVALSTEPEGYWRRHMQADLLWDAREALEALKEVSNG